MVYVYCVHNMCDSKCNHIHDHTNRLLSFFKVQRVLFADICKEGAAPLTSHVMKLKATENLPADWLTVTAPKTYNPLGNTTTFLNVEDITAGVQQLLKKR